MSMFYSVFVSLCHCAPFVEALQPRSSSQRQSSIIWEDPYQDSTTNVPSLSLSKLSPEHVEKFRAIQNGSVTKKQVELVLARHAEEIGWSDMYSSIRTLYCNGDVWENPESFCVRVPNTGREGGVYLRHIVTRYDNLSEWTVFSQAGIPTDHYRGHRLGGGHMQPGASLHDFIFAYDQNVPGGVFMYFNSRVHIPTFKLSIRSTYANKSFTSEATPPVCPDPAGSPPEVWNNWTDFGWFREYIAEKCNSTQGDFPRFLERYFRESIDAEMPVDGIAYYGQGARFAVSKESILARPKSYYQKLLSLIDGEADPCYNYLNEWIWFYMFGKHAPCNSEVNSFATQPVELMQYESPASETDDDEFVRCMWSGAECSGGNSFLETAFVEEGLHKTTTHQLSEEKIRVQVFGMYNFGTNAFTFLLDTLHVEAIVCPGGELPLTRERCKNNSAPYKHASPVSVQEWFSNSTSEDHRVIFIVRNPLSWLASMKEHPYGLESCVHANNTNWISATCHCKGMVEMGVKDGVCAPGQASYSSMAELWNQYMAGYKDMVESSTHQATIVRYEDLVNYPTQTMLGLEAHLALERSHNWQAERVMQEAAKKNGKGRRGALQELREQSYRKRFTDSDLVTLCGLLDMKLLQAFGYARECINSAQKLREEKLVWFHVPKAGSSFGNALLSYSCHSLPQEVAYIPSYEGKNLREWIRTSGYTQRCAPLNLALESCGGHSPLTSNDTCVGWQSGQAVGMFRQPEQRILSAYHHTYVNGTHKPWGVNTNVSLDLYKTWQAGCATRMLTGRNCLDEHGSPIDAATIQLAKQRLHAFAFVGLTEEWHLSMCLFSAMTGASCHERMLANNRTSVDQPSTPHDITPLNGWRDSVDGNVYEEAKAIFYQRLEEYGVTSASCAKACAFL